MNSLRQQGVCIAGEVNMRREGERSFDKSFGVPIGSQIDER